MWASKDEIQTGQVAMGDLLVCEGGEVGRAAILTQKPEEPTIIQNALHRVRSQSEMPKFLMYLLEVSASGGWLEVKCNKATIQHFTRDKFGSLRIALPSLDEQCRIVSFLDRETAKIDALIEKKERLIELLQEKRTALITQAVTKGLDPTVPMKDSGVEWLGKIPAHWSVHRLKLLASINDEALSEKTDPQFEIVYVDIGGVDNIQGILECEEYLFETAPSRARRIVRDGDVIISTVRTYLRAITPIIAPECNLIVSTGFAVVRPTSRLNSNYGAFALRATYFVENIVANSTGVSYPAIEASKVSSFSIAFPELMEQQRIAAFLDRETAKIDALMSKIREAITSLREYRTALISAAVTGKIDVREA
jgi:type I restriction enzyme S subunit